MTPRVSVCIPAYNAERHLPATLDSVWAQDFEDFEVIVVDDASTDRTAEILRSSNDPRLKYWLAATNAGQGQTTDAALAHASGEFIKFLDADDLLHPRCLRKMVDSLDTHPTASFAFCRREVIVEQASEEVARAWLVLHAEPHSYFPKLEAINNGQSLLREWVSSGMDENWIAEPAGVMARRACLERAGGYSRRVRLTIDMDLWARLMTTGDVAFIDEELYTYRFAVDGVTGDALQAEGNWADGLWSLEALLALESPPDLTTLRAKRRQLVRKAIRIAISDLRSRHPSTKKARDLAAYAKYRLAVAAGRSDPIFALPPAKAQGT